MHRINLTLKRNVWYSCKTNKITARALDYTSKVVVALEPVLSQKHKLSGGQIRQLKDGGYDHTGFGSHLQQGGSNNLSRERTIFSGTVLLYGIKGRRRRLYASPLLCVKK